MTACRSYVRRIVVVISILGACTTAGAADGLDPTFGDQGLALLSLSTDEDFATAVVVQPDGRIVVGGSVTTGISETGVSLYDFFVARLDVDGGLDATFGTDGVAITPISAGRDVLSALALQPDGKIVAVGQVGQSSEIALVRYGTDGTLDATFGTGGISLVPPTTGVLWPRRVALQPDGKILLAVTDPGPLGLEYSLALLRFLPDGSLDSSFDGDGVAVAASPDVRALGGAVAVQPDGKIIVSGSRFSSGGVLHGVAVARFLSDGSLDSTFDGDGITGSWNPSGASSPKNGLVLQPDGKVVVVGAGGPFVWRYLPDGSPDTTFGPGGRASPLWLIDLFDGQTLVDAALQPDGGLVIVGDTAFSRPLDTRGERDLVLLRLKPDGQRDATFGSDGIITTSVLDDDWAGGVAIQADARVLLVGSASGPQPESAAVLGFKVTGCPDIQSTCRTSWDRGFLLAEERGAEHERRRVVVKLLRGPEISQSDLGDPLVLGGTAYRACIYDDSEKLLVAIDVDRAGATCGSANCWKAIGQAPPAGRGYRYRDRHLVSDGVNVLRLKGGRSGFSKIVFKGRSNPMRRAQALPFLMDRLSGHASVTLQVVASDVAGCDTIDLLLTEESLTGGGARIVGR